MGRSQRIVVVGAGAAGLYAAFNLHKAKRETVVLEAGHRAGGRVCTTCEGLAPGLFGELGAMRFADGHPLTWGCVDRYRLRVMPFTMQDPTALAYFSGRAHRWGEIEAGGVELIPGLGPAPTSNEWNEAFQKVCGQTPQAGIDWVEIERRTKSTAFDKVMREIGWSDGQIHSFALRHGVEARITNTFVRVARDIVIKGSQRLWRLADGMDQLISELLGDVPEIRYGARVKAIEQSATGVRVSYQTLGGEQNLEANAVVIAIPVPALGQITFSPPLSPNKQAAIRQIPYDNCVKTILQVRGHRWIDQDGVEAGVSLTDLPIRNVHYPEPEEATNRERNVLVVGYTWGEDAQRLAFLSDADRLRLMITNLAMLHPGIERDVEVGVTKVWQADPLFGGAFPIYPPGRKAELMQAISSPEGRLFFAGEHTDTGHGWIEGALASGLRSARMIEETV
jgi:monoamine oxidase